MAEPIRTCAHCAEQLPADAPGQRRYCSTRCGVAARRRAKGVKTRWGDEGPASHQTHQCVVCDKEFKPKRAGRTTTCGQACGWIWSREKRKAKSRPTVTVRMRRCQECNALFVQSRGSLTCSDACRAEKARRISRLHNMHKNAHIKGARPCQECGQTFSPEYGDRSRTYCSKQCSDRSTRRVAKKRRRARERATSIEPVNPTKVFERDGWKCRMCGVKTPRARRGTIAPNAPEMDHIVPLADGGDHTYRNVQTSCRTCNSAKGAGPGGQLLLFG